MFADISFRLTGLLLAAFLSGCSKPPSLLMQTIDFETADFSQLKNPCSGCDKKDKKTPKIISGFAYEGQHSARYQVNHKRSESSTYRFFTEKDTEITLYIYIPADHFGPEDKATVTQIIPWQRNCFEKGMFHLRVEKGYWAYYFRLGGVRRDKRTSIPVKYNAWNKVRIRGKFSSIDGYVQFFVGNNSRVDVALGEPTFPDCPLGPYLKFGLYAGADTENVIFVDSVSIKQKN